MNSKKGDHKMSDDINNNGMTPDEDPVQNGSDNTQDAAPDSSSQSDNGAERREEHTSVPGGDQSGYTVYGRQGSTVWSSDGQYRTVYTRPDQDNAYNRQNVYGQNNNYGRNGSYGQNYGGQYNTQRVNPYSQNNGYNYNSGYGYGYQTNRTAPDYAQPQAQVQTKKSTGKTVAIILISVFAVIFVIAALAAGIAIGKLGYAGSGEDTQTPDTVYTQPDSTDKAAPSTTKQEPVTDPAATLNTDSSNTVYPMTEAAAKTVDSVVEIRTEQVVSGSFMQQYIAQGAGSGVIVTSDGYIATNNHVIDGATQITVILRDGTEYKGTLVGADATSDLAVVKIDAKGLKPATFGDSDELIIAQSVIAIGNPLGELGGSVTEGIISALARNVTIEKQEMTLLQTTAAVNPGNSGGGLFNLSGECIGIVNAKSTGEDVEGIGFAIPSNTAIPVIEDLMKYGYVRGRVMIGISMVEIFDSYSMRRYGVSDYGVYVGSVTEGSDAEKAGIQVGDRLVSVGGETVESFQQVKNIVQSCKVGDTLSVTVSRNGQQKTMIITLTEYIPK